MGLRAQLSYLATDYSRLLRRRKLRVLYVWMSRIGVALLMYRVERGLYLTLGPWWERLRIIFLPLLNLLSAYTNCEIHYKADIGPGLLVLHPAMGVVVSAKFVIGEWLTMVGGNVIGGKPTPDAGEHRIGHHCTLGANAVVLGPITLGDHVQVGGLALVNRDAPDHAVLVGVPAKNVASVPAAS